MRLPYYNHNHLRETGLYQTWLAEGHARAGDLDAAGATLDQARTNAAHIDSARLQRRINAIDTLVTRRSGKRAPRP